MIQTCPKCGADVRDVAKFCDQCGQVMSGDAATETASSSAAAPAAGLPVPPESSAATVATPAVSTASKQPIQWGPIIGIGIILGLVAIIIFPPKAPDTENEMPAGAHGEGGAAMMEEVMQQVDELKAKLDENPADTATLVEMYGLYSMVGKFEEVQPYLENWLSEVESNADLDKDAKWEEATKLLELTTSANHIEGTKALMQFYQRTEPDNVFFIRALGDICYNLDQFQESADYYSRYLELSSPEEDGENYWGARVDRATMLMAMAEENNEPEKLEESVIELQQVTQDYPELWQAWFNLGKAYLAKEDETQAEETFKIALTRSRNSMDEWLAESELAKLRGEEPPPMPASPHGSMDGSGGGNFHGTP